MRDKYDSDCMCASQPAVREAAKHVVFSQVSLTSLALTSQSVSECRRFALLDPSRPASQPPTHHHHHHHKACLAPLLLDFQDFVPPVIFGSQRHWYRLMTIIQHRCANLCVALQSIRLTNVTPAIHLFPFLLFGEVK